MRGFSCDGWLLGSLVRAMVGGFQGSEWVARVGRYGVFSSSITPHQTKNWPYTSCIRNRKKNVPSIDNRCLRHKYHKHKISYIPVSSLGLSHHGQNVIYPNVAGVIYVFLRRRCGSRGGERVLPVPHMIKTKQKLMSSGKIGPRNNANQHITNTCMKQPTPLFAPIEMARVLSSSQHR